MANPNVERPDIGHEGLTAPDAEAEEKARMGVSEVDNMLNEPIYGFMVKEGEQNNADFWAGVSKAFKEKSRTGEAGDTRQLTDSIDNAVKALRAKQTVDTRQLVQQINSMFQQ